MDVRSLQIDRFPGGTKLQRPIRVLVEQDNGNFYASAPELGMWIDGVGVTNLAALEDLEKVISLHRESLSNLECETASDYLRTMKSAFEQIVG